MSFFEMTIEFYISMPYPIAIIKKISLSFNINSTSGFRELERACQRNMAPEILS
ncbi:MAG: hypothetical protein V3W19_14635 [Desulfatiglandales bacterium]